MTEDRLQHLIDRYLNKTATAGELAELEQWYEQQQQVKPGPFDHQELAAFEAFQQQVLNRVHQHIAGAETPVILLRRPALWLRWTAVAAAVVLIVAAGLWISRQPAAEVSNAMADRPSRSQTPLNFIHHNAPGDTLIHLEDGSQVLLAAYSSIHYEHPFAANKRTIWLRGKAFFQVAKDASRPFTVYSRSISTTALGTAFTITAFDTAAAVRVQLHEGKVVIKQADSAAQHTIADTYLQAGQELAYNMQTRVLAVKYAAPAGRMPVASQSPALLAGQHTGMEASFEEEPLVSVLQQMEKKYHARLRFNAAELADMEFSGNIRAKDSLGYVLRRIAMLHQLTLIEKTDGYLIRKNQ